MISISIVEEDHNVRRTITDLLQSHDRFLIKGQYAVAETALSGLVSDAPDIAIVDLQMPGMSGVELINRLKKSLPNTQYLVSTSNHDNESLFEALQAGASGHILKDNDSNTIANAIIELHNGGSPMSPIITRRLISQLQRRKNAITEEHKLTRREEEILERLSTGLMYKEIAEQMNISILTVKNHLKNIYRKLNVQNKVEAVNKYKNS